MAKQKTYSQEYVDNHECTWTTNNKRFKNLIGNVYDKLTVIKMHYREAPHTFWLLRCTCGSHISLSTNNIANGRKSCSVCTFKSMSERSLVPKEENLRLVRVNHPTLECVSYKEGVKSESLWYCYECNTPFYHRVSRLKETTKPLCRCNHNKFCRWTQQLRTHQIKEIAALRGLQFLGWKDTYKGNTSRFYLKCDKHKHFESNVNNFTNTKQTYGCPYCSFEKPTVEKHTVAEMKVKSVEIHGEGSYSYDNFEYTCSRTASEIMCNTCNKPSYNSYDNHINKKQGCRCKACYGFNSKISASLYLHQLDNVAVKYGITNHDPYERMRLQGTTGDFSHDMLRIYSSSDGQKILDTETYIKQNIQKHFLTKEQLGQGFSETMCISRLEETIEYLDSVLGVPTFIKGKVE